MSVEELTWKAQKERFVSGLSGTTLLEVFLLLGYFPAFLLLRAILLKWIPPFVRNVSLFRFIFDFMLTILPFILAVTELSDISAQVLVAVIIFDLTALLFLSGITISVEKETNATYIQHIYDEAINESLNKSFERDINASDELKQFKKPAVETSVVSSKLPFLASCRAFISIPTCICILAVDFHAFPRRLAKTEEFGTGLMDVGIGMYILSNALVSKEARSRHLQNFSLLNLKALVLQIISSWPIALLGIIRLCSVKLLGYQEHISEYGMHWNFFLSLALVKNFAAIVSFFTHGRYSLTAFVLIGFCYQFVLVSPFIDATDTLLNNKRDGFLMQNKEGLASCFGLLALYFASVSIGRYLFKPRHSLQEWQKVAVNLVFVSAVFWFLLYKCQVEVQPVSRRLCNLSYILWLLALSTYQIAALLAVHIISVRYIANNWLPECSMPDKWYLNPPEKSSMEIVYSPPSPPKCLICALSRNQLFYFLISNLLTGIINGVVDTLSVNTFSSVLIIIAYQFLITLICWSLHMKDITLKFW